MAVCEQHYHTLTTLSLGADLYHPLCVRSGAGAHFSLWARNALVADSASAVLERARASGTPVYAAVASATSGEVARVDELPSAAGARTDFESADSVALVLGHEAHGVRSDLKPLVDRGVWLRMSGVESLNASVAAGILLYNRHV